MAPILLLYMYMQFSALLLLSNVQNGQVSLWIYMNKICRTILLNINIIPNLQKRKKLIWQDLINTRKLEFLDFSQ